MNSPTKNEQELMEEINRLRAELEFVKDGVRFETIGMLLDIEHANAKRIEALEQRDPMQTATENSKGAVNGVVNLLESVALCKHAHDNQLDSILEELTKIKERINEVITYAKWIKSQYTEQ